MSRLILYCLHHQMTVAVLECRGSDWLLKLKNIFQKSHLVWVPNILSSNSPPGLHSPDASVLCCCFRIARSLGLWRLRACRPASASEASLPSSTFVAEILIHFRKHRLPTFPPNQHHPPFAHLGKYFQTFPAGPLCSVYLS